MNQYCTIEDVLSVATVFRQDVMPLESGDEARYNTNTNAISRDEVDYIITEASEMVRGLLQPKYDLTVIDSYAEGEWPPIINYCTKTYSAILMYERFGSVSIERNERLIKSLKRSYNQYREIIANGTIRDRDGVLVPSLVTTEVQQGSTGTDFYATKRLKEVYESGRSY